jgi:hypothetical protein
MTSTAPVLAFAALLVTEPDRQFVQGFHSARECNEALFLRAAKELADPDSTVSFGCINADGFRPTAVLLWREPDYRLRQDVDLTQRRGGDRP